MIIDFLIQDIKRMFMSKLRLLVLLFFVSVWNSMILFPQDVKSQITSAQKIILGGKEYYLHVVQRGEGLYRISVNYGVSQQEILDANDGVTESLKVGQVLNVPVIKGRNSTVQELNRSAVYMYHTIEKGETAYSVAKKYNVSVESVYENNLGTREGLVEGAILKIPVITTNKSIISNEKNSGQDSFFYYTVEPKDTLFGIAQKYNTTVDLIVESNPALRNGILNIGSVIRIPKSVINSAGQVKQSSDGTQQFIDSGDYLFHTIQSGQTFFSISRQYQVDVEKIKDANPGVSQDDLKVGYLLRVPRPSVANQTQVSDDKLYTTHKVKRKETLYGISRQYHVDTETIKLLNSTVDFNKLSKGVELRIPTDAWFASRTATVLTNKPEVTVKEKDQAPAVAVVSPVNCSGKAGLARNSSVKVALLLPFGGQDISEDDSSRVLRSSSSSSSRSKISSEIYSGMLLALDTLKKQGVNVELSVFDIAPDSLAIKRVLDNSSLANADLIIGPAFAHELPMVSSYSLNHKIPLVYPISNTNPELLHNPYLFHINTPDSLYYNQMAGEIVRQSQGATLVVILPSESETEAMLLVQKIRQRVNSGHNINYKEYNTKGGSYNVQSLINKDGANFIVVPTVKEVEVSKIIPVLVGVKDRTKADITLFGMSDWLRLQTIDPEQIHKLNGSVFSPLGIDYQQVQTRNFISKFRKWYHTEPHAISPYFHSSGITSNFSRYGIWGYDVTYYFVSAISEYGHDFDLCLDKFKHQEIQFNFDFKRISNWGGFYNQGLFILKFHTDLRTERIPVKM